jgi:hypothetical protein
MEWAMHMGKFTRLINLFLSIIIRYYRNFNIYVPLYVLFVIAFIYLINSTTKPYSNEQYKFLFVIIGITATFSGLSFRASSYSENILIKSIYYEQGKRLFHASISLAISISFMYIRNEIHNLVFMEFFNKHSDILNIIKFVCSLFGQFYFIIAMVHLYNALEKLNKVLFDDQLLP